MNTRNIVLLALGLVAVGIVLTLLFGRPSQARQPSSHSGEHAHESLNCFAPVSELFWRKRL